MDYSPKNLIKILEEKGYKLKKNNRQSSYILSQRREEKKTAVVPIHGNRDIPKGTFLTILRQTGISKDEV